MKLLRYLSLALLAVALANCNKTKPTKAIITVVDPNDVVVANAYVKLFANPTDPIYPDYSRLTKEGYTDARGIVEFDYSEFYKKGQAGFAVLDILAKKDTLQGEGIIKILEEEENTAKVKILPQGP